MTATIIKSKDNVVLGALANNSELVATRKNIEKLAQQHNLVVADMPMLIRAISTHYGIRQKLEHKFSDIATLTSEYHGLRNGDPCYEVWHSVGSLSTLIGLQKADSKPDAGHISYTDRWFAIDENEWELVGKGTYNDQNIVRIHLTDLKKGNIPPVGTPYVIYVRLDKDYQSMRRSKFPRIHPSGRLDYDTFMKDDRALMIAGSHDNREKLAKTFFHIEDEEDRKEKDEGFGSFHRIINEEGEIIFQTPARGCLVAIATGSAYFGGTPNIDPQFLALNKQETLEQKTSNYFGQIFQRIKKRLNL